MQGIQAMKIIELTHIIDNAEQEKQLSELAKRCEKINGWTEKDLLQFAVQTMPMYHVWLMYLDDIVHDFEQEKVNKSFWDFLKSIRNK